MYRGRLRTMMVTGDHYMTASAVAHSLGIFEMGSTRVVLDMILAKPAASEAPTAAQQQVSKATAAAASRFGGTQRKHQDPMQAALRHSVAQDSRLTAASSPSPGVTFRFNADEVSKLAAVRASLQESLRMPSASSAAAPFQQAAALSASPAAANTACQLSARSFSRAPAVHAADTAASPAAAIAASSALFRSSSQQAAAPAASPAAAASAATSAAFPAAAKAPSPLLISYLQSMGMVKAQAGSAHAQAESAHAQAESAQAQASSAQAQQVSAQAQAEAGSAQAQASSAQAQAASAQAQARSAQAQAGSAQAAPLHAQSRFANRYKSVSLHASQALHHSLDRAFILV